MNGGGLPLFGAVFVAGGLGCVARYGVVTATSTFVPTFGPAGTFLVNAAGSFLAGLLAATGTAVVHGDTRTVIAAGFLGGFTTYSAFNTELLTLARAGQVGTAAVYFAATTVGALVAGAAGVGLGLRIVR